MAKTLTIYLAADTRKLSQGLTSANQQLTGFSGTLKNMLGPALIGATAAAGALAVKLAVDGVNAAIEDEKSAASLAQTLQNLGLAHDTGPVEAYIDALQRQTGVADSDLRPAFDRLVRSIGDTAKAQDALQLALDVSAGSGRSLDQVAQALGRAYDGNTTALSRLGAGIDAAVLRTGDMERITAQLASTFGGQAAVAASTYEGRINRLNVAAGELQEAFGYGLLSGLTAFGDSADDATATLEDLQPLIRNTGRDLGIIANEALKAALALATLGSDSEETSDGLSLVSLYTDSLRFTLPGLGGLIDIVSDKMLENGRAAVVMAEGIDQAYDSTIRLAQQQRATEQTGRQLAASTYDSGVSALAAARHTERLTKLLGHAPGVYEEVEQAQNRAGAATEQLNTRLDRQTETVTGLQQALRSQVAELERGATAVNSYVESVAGKILGGLNLGEAYAQQFDEEGNRVGKTLIEAFQAQVNQAEWFGNVLNAIRASGGSERLINAIAAEGPEAGGALGQQIIDQGLIPELDRKLTDAAAAANTVGVAMAATFAPNGVEASVNMVNGIAEQLGKEGKRLGRIGEEMGKPIGARLKAQIAEDVAAAVRAAEAAGAAARAEAVAREEARQAAITTQAIASAVQRLIVQSDQRAGRDTRAVLS